MRTTLASPGILRLLLAFVVVIYHDSRLGFGTWAVYVFFALSGYWVTLMYRKKYLSYNTPVVAFYISRYLRLIPMLVICYALLLMLMAFSRDPGIGTLSPLWFVRAFAIAGSTFQNVPLVPAWSLDVEFQFYLFLPLLAALLCMRGRHAARWAMAGAALFFPLTLLNPGESQAHLLYSYLSFFLLGVANACRPWRPSEKAGFFFLAAFFASIVILIWVPITRGMLLGGAHPGALYRYNPQLSAFLAVVFFPFLCYSVSLRSSALDKHLGGAAYALYLFHWIPHYAINTGRLLAPHSKPVLVGTAFLIDAVGCAVLYWLAERPLDRARSRFIEAHFGAAKIAGPGAPVISTDAVSS